MCPLRAGSVAVGIEGWGLRRKIGRRGGVGVGVWVGDGDGDDGGTRREKKTGVERDLDGVYLFVYPPPPP